MAENRASVNSQGSTAGSAAGSADDSEEDSAESSAEGSTQSGTGSMRGSAQGAAERGAGGGAAGGMTGGTAGGMTGGVKGGAEGVPCWVDVQLPDIEAGKRFYGELFGWTFEEKPGGGRPGEGRAGDGRPGEGNGASSRSVSWAHRRGEPVAALLRKRDGRMPTVWTVYLATRSANSLARRIRDAGGTVITPPEPEGTLGTVALAADPEGAVFGLWQPGTHPGFGRRHEPGTFTWAQLYTRDTDAASDFYSGLFGSEGDPEVGVAPVSDVFPAEMPPHFLIHFAVRDCEEVLGAVYRLGGRVQVPPFDTEYGRVAVVTDNQGASFAVLQR